MGMVGARATTARTVFVVVLLLVVAALALALRPGRVATGSGAGVGEGVGPGDSGTPVARTAKPCGGCHPREATAWSGSVHAREGVTCPICHGEARRHSTSGGRIRDVRSPRRLPYEAGVYLCGRCHDLRQFHRSQHYQVKILDCFSCHKAHAFSPAEGTVSFCGVTGCHPDAARGWRGHRNRLARASCAGCHMPVTSDWTTGERGVNHTLRPALARESLADLPHFP